MKSIPPQLLNDRYWRGIIHLFQNHYKLNSVFNTKYFDLESGDVRVTALKRVAAPWSESEKFVLALALHFFNERNKVNLSDMDYLDDENKRLCIEAIKFRYM